MVIEVGLPNYVGVLDIADLARSVNEGPAQAGDVHSDLAVLVLETLCEQNADPYVFLRHDLHEVLRITKKFKLPV